MSSRKERAHSKEQESKDSSEDSQAENTSSSESSSEEGDDSDKGTVSKKSGKYHSVATSDDDTDSEEKESTPSSSYKQWAAGPSPFAPARPNIFQKPWVEKYRPYTWSDVIGNKQTISIIKTMVQGHAPENGKGAKGTVSMSNFLIHGPPGSGKTSCVNVIKRELYGIQAIECMVLELNGSEERGIEIVRQKITDFVRTTNAIVKALGGMNSQMQKFKLVVIDEFDAMTTEAQAVLRRLMEESADNARFILICNYKNKIDPAICSRCVHFGFQPPDSKSATKMLSDISQKENVIIKEDALESITELCSCDMRKSINTLQILSLQCGNRRDICKLDVYTYFNILNQAQLDHVQDLINEKNGIIKTYHYLCNLQREHGMDLKLMLFGLHRYVRKEKMSDKVRCRMLMDLSNLETQVATSECDQIHLGTMTGIISHWQLGK
jgi:DNA polymerase III delta prime subunit